MIHEDEFREDLYFRINTFEIRLPPLRERRQDIPELARHLLGRAARRPIEQVAELLTPEAIDVLLEHDWPGNVRELANVMEHAYILAGGEPIMPEHLPHQRAQREPVSRPTISMAAGQPRDVGSAHASRGRGRCKRSRWSTSCACWTSTAAASPPPPRNWGSASRRCTTS